MKGTSFLSGNEGEGLKTGEAHNLVALFEVGVTGFDNFCETEGAHDFAELYGSHVLRDVHHPDTHGGVDGKISHARESLAVLEDGKRGFLELKDVGSDEFFGACGENPLTIGVGHGDEHSREALTRDQRSVTGEKGEQAGGAGHGEIGKGAGMKASATGQRPHVQRRPVGHPARSRLEDGEGRGMV